MPLITATFDLKPIHTRLRGVPRLVRAHCRRRLSYWGRYFIADIRKHGSAFKHAVRRARKTKFTAAPVRKGRLLASLWTRRVKERDPKQLIGWGVPYGEVLEFGPRGAKTWTIRPKGFRSDITSRGGGKTGLKFLRFQWRGKICYARQVTHVWTKDQLRPHVAPAFERHEKNFMADIGSIPKRVIEGKLR